MTTTTQGILDPVESSTPRVYEKGKWVAYVQYALGVALLLPLALDAHRFSRNVPTGYAGPDITEVLFQYVMLNLFYLGRVYRASTASPPSRIGDFFLVLSLLFALLWSASCIWITTDRWSMRPYDILFFCTWVALMGAVINASALGRWRAAGKQLKELKLIREKLRSHGRIEQ